MGSMFVWMNNPSSWEKLKFVLYFSHVQSTGVRRWFGLGSNNNDSYKFNLFFTLGLLSKLSVKQKKWRATTPSPPASYTYTVLGVFQPNDLIFFWLKLVYLSPVCSPRCVSPENLLNHTSPIS